MEDFKVMQAAIDKAFKSGVYNTQEAAQVLQAMAKVGFQLEQAISSHKKDEQNPEKNAKK